MAVSRTVVIKFTADTSELDAAIDAMVARLRALNPLPPEDDEQEG